MIGDPQSIKAFKTSITPENVKFFWDSDSDRICSDCLRASKNSTLSTDHIYF